MVVCSILIGYLLGSVSFAVLVAKSYKLDIFSVGSCNAGFTNVLRVLGWKAASIVLVGDILKGTLAAFAGDMLGGHKHMIIAAVFAILGHTFSCFIKFKGGKGVATGAGVLLYISPITFLGCAFTLSSLAYFTGYMSLGSIASAIVCPIILLLTNADPIITAVFSCCAAYVIWKHRQNIVRLLKGTENKIRKK